jgi:PEP-CTERM motif
MKRFVFCVLFGVLLFAPGAANAVSCFSSCSNTFNYQFLFQGDNLTVSLSGQLTASNTPDPNAPYVGGYDIQSINGTVTVTGLYTYSSSISSFSGGLIPINPQSPPSPVSYFSSPLFSGPYDNVLYYPQANFGSVASPVLGYFDPNGIFFKDDAGIYYNIYTNIPTTSDPILFYNLDTNNTIAGAAELFSSSISPVPEPSTWAMLLVGFAGLGLIAYRRKRKVSHSLV